MPAAPCPSRLCPPGQVLQECPYMLMAPVSQPSALGRWKCWEFMLPGVTLSNKKQELVNKDLSVKVPQCDSSEVYSAPCVHSGNSHSQGSYWISLHPSHPHSHMCFLGSPPM